MGWRVRKESKGGIVVAFTGHLGTAEAVASAEEFCKQIAADGVDVEWDLREMAGYDSAARKVWQEKLAPRRRQIRSITVVGGSAMTRMGASAIALVLGLKCTFLSAPSGGER